MWERGVFISCDDVTATCDHPIGPETSGFFRLDEIKKKDKSHNYNE